MIDRILLLAAVAAAAAAGPFYECRYGSEQRYQVNLCVDRCPEVGSQRGCSGNRTCCLVGCARICFHERRSTPLPEPVTETTTLQSTTTPRRAHQEAMLYIRHNSDLSSLIASGDGSDEMVSVNETEPDLVANETIADPANMSQSETLPYEIPVMTNELKDFTPGLLLPSTLDETTMPKTDPVTPAPHSVTPDFVDLITPLHVLGKLRFSSSSDKVLSKDEVKAKDAIVKTFQQWNGVNDNFNNALDDAQRAIQTKSGDSALLWQIFEFLRIIQSKLDVVNTNNGMGKWARLVAGDGVRSKPPLSPHDPNILIRKSLSDFTKTLGKVQNELTSLTAGQQAIMRVLERVFVNQLRLANGAAAVAAATANTINARRQQRWQKPKPTGIVQAGTLNQLTPLAEAIMLDNASLMGAQGFLSRDTSNCYRLNGCSFDLCRLARCPKFPDSTCRINSCRKCEAEFFVGNTRVQCN